MSKNLTIGSWITLGHWSIAEIMADAGFDWLCIDLEHSTIDYSEAAKLINTIQGKGIPAFVRVGANDPLIIKRILDAGADGIIVPMVNNVNDAKNAIMAVKYPPVGARGVGLSRAQGYGFDFENYRDGKAKEIKLIVQIEHHEAINNLKEILSLDGIDGSFIGPYDLSGSMGKPGQYDDADVKEKLDSYTAITSEFEKLVGYHVVEASPERVKEKISEGYNFIAFSLDTMFLGSIIRDQLKSIRQ